MEKLTIKNKRTCSVILPAVGGCLLLAAVFQGDASLTNGIVMEKVFWFSRAMILFAAILLLYGFIKRDTHIHIGVPDILICAFAGITWLTYDRTLQAEPEKLLFGGQLLLLWGMLRIFLKQLPSLRSVFLIFIVYTGLIEAIWGLEQLYGHRMSTHSAFRLTGSFYNPGPYSGYLAAVLPVSLHYILRAGRLRRAGGWNYVNGLYYFAWICCITILLVLPAGMSRTAWVAAIVSCGWVFWMEQAGWKKTKRFFLKHPKKIIAAAITGMICLSFAFYGVFHLKEDSANGRLLTWKITARAIGSAPLQGKGLGGFPAAYAEEQAAYFSSGMATQTEQLVAGCPEYAFNEYLQIATEQGLAGLALYVMWLGSCFYYGIKNRRWGAAGGLLSIAVFSCASYPLQLPSFGILLLFLSAICVSSSSGGSIRFRVNAFYPGIILAIVSFFLSYRQLDYSQAYKEWSKVQVSYNGKAYQTAVPTYAELYARLNHKPEFLFEYAQCLGNSGFHREATVLLNRAGQLSADPMIHYMAAKNRQALGEYEKAEASLLYGIDILPERIYPYYLLSLLYAEPGFYQAGKLCAAMDSVLLKEPKVYTTAIREMRDKVNKLREEMEVISPG